MANKYLDQAGLQHYTQLVQGMADGDTIEYGNVEGESGKKLYIARIPDGSVGAAAIQPGSITTELLKDGSVTEQKLNALLRIKLGIGTVDDMTEEEIVEALTTTDAATQAEIVALLDSDTVGAWNIQSIVEICEGMDSTVLPNFVQLIDLEDFAWSEIQQIPGAIGANQAAANKLVGKTKSASFGASGSMSCMVIGVNHDNLSTGSGKASLTFMTKAPVGTGQMNSSTGEVLYKNTSMCSYLNATVYEGIGSGLKAQIKEVAKVCNSIFSETPAETYTERLNLKVFLLSIKECKLSDSYEGSVYQYFSSGKKHPNVNASNNLSAWTRTPGRTISPPSEYCAISKSGTRVYEDINSSKNVYPAFCI